MIRDKFCDICCHYSPVDYFCEVDLLNEVSAGSNLPLSLYTITHISLITPQCASIEDLSLQTGAKHEGTHLKGIIKEVC